MGRTNKLVDGCYSYWQGALIPLLQELGPELLQQSDVPRTLPGATEDPAATAFIVPSFPARKPRNLDSQAQDAIDRCQVRQSLLSASSHSISRHPTFTLLPILSFFQRKCPNAVAAIKLPLPDSPAIV